MCCQCSKPSVIDYKNNSYCADCFERLFVKCVTCLMNLERDEAIIIDGVAYCTTCFSNQFVFCQNCGCVERISNTLRGIHGRYCLRCHRRLFSFCANCGECCNSYELLTAPDGLSYCQACFDINCGFCANCGTACWQRHLHQGLNGRRYCEDCNPEHDEWDMGVFDIPNPVFNEIGSTRRFGVELETSTCPSHRTLFEQTIWECKRDCSIAGREFVSPILYGDEGLAEIRSFCHIANTKGWSVDSYCGYHVHLDVSNESWKALRSIAIAYRMTTKLWQRLVPDQRANNAYCGRPNYTLSQLSRIRNAEDWDYFVGSRDRFEFVNWRSYLVHGSVEIRSHAGTLDADEINNWIKLHARFIDAVSKMPISELATKFCGGFESQYVGIENIVGRELGDIYSKKANSYRKPVRNNQPFILGNPFSG